MSLNILSKRLKTPNDKMQEHLGCDIILDDFSLNPHCPHGPSVQFSRNGKKFYACSAYRSRQLCPFYLSVDDRDKKKQTVKGRRDKQPVDNSIMLEGLRNPENNYGQAQYYFSDETLNFFLGLFDRLCVTSLLCVGTPFIHEKCRQMSHLLDIDRKFEIIEKKFTRYNMCNHYFFTDRYNYTNHLKHSSDLLVICDPPFGARLELIMFMFKSIEKDWMIFSHTGKIQFILINPYFVEGKLLKLDSAFKMSDYKVEYASHKKFKTAAKSPVRFFTTIDLSKIVLPGDDYKFCVICQKYVSAISKHCKVCGTCDSRDGKKYYHCDACGKCFKRTWSHCEACNLCHLEGTTQYCSVKNKAKQTLKRKLS